MGYTTEFQGHFDITPQPTGEILQDLNNLAKERHNNYEDEDMPSLYCQWVSTKDGKGLKWDGGEKFYGYVKWLQYIIDQILEPNAYKLNRKVQYRGEDFSDVGEIMVVNNEISVKKIFSDEVAHG